MKAKILILSNGTSGIWDEKGNQTGLKSWLEVYCEYLEANGVDPTEARITGPSGQMFNVFKTKDPDTDAVGFNWSI